jgi:hypothetical protein
VPFHFPPCGCRLSRSAHMLVFTKRQRALLEIQRRRNDRDTYTKPLLHLSLSCDDDEEDDFFHDFDVNIYPDEDILDGELVKYSSVRSFYDELVVQTQLVSHRDFWQRYFCRTHSIDRVVRELSLSASGDNHHGNNNNNIHSSSSPLSSSSHSDEEDAGQPQPQRGLLLAERPDKQTMMDRLAFNPSHTTTRRTTTRPRESLGPMSLFAFVLPQMSQITTQAPDLLPATTMESSSSSNAAVSPKTIGRENGHMLAEMASPVDETATATTTSVVTHHNNVVVEVNPSTIENPSVVARAKDGDDDETTSTTDNIVLNKNKAGTTTHTPTHKMAGSSLLGALFFGDKCRGATKHTMTQHRRPSSRRAQSLGGTGPPSSRRHPEDQHHHKKNRRRTTVSPSLLFRSCGPSNNLLAMEDDDDDGNEIDYEYVDNKATTSPIKTIFVPNNIAKAGSPYSSKEEDGSWENLDGPPSSTSDDNDDKSVPPTSSSTATTEFMSVLHIVLAVLIATIFHQLGERGVSDLTIPYYNGLCAPYIPFLKLPLHNFAVEAPWWAPGWHDGFRVVCGPYRVQTRLEWRESRTAGMFQLTLLTTVDSNDSEPQAKKRMKKKKIESPKILYQSGKRLQSARVMANEIIVVPQQPPTGSSHNAKVATTTTIPAPWKLRIPPQQD